MNEAPGVRLEGVLFTSARPPPPLGVLRCDRAFLARVRASRAVVVQILGVPREGSVLAGSLVEASGAP